MGEAARGFCILVVVSFVAIGLGVLAADDGIQAAEDHQIYLPGVHRTTGPPQFETENVLAEEGLQYTDIQDTGDGRMFLVLRQGTIRIMNADGNLLLEPFLDIRDSVVAEHGEQGLFAITLHPDYEMNRFFYVAYTRAGAEQEQWFVVISRFTRMADDPDRADPDSELVILEVEKSTEFHNGGALQFGPQDGYLYVTIGDAGSRLMAQDGQSLYGKLLRIDVDGGDPYAIPPSNPFVGDPTVRDEIWALGLRNAWRVRFDRGTGDLYIADVGGVTAEEVNFLPAGEPGGQNYGWPCYEGRELVRPSACQEGVTYEMPVYDYHHIVGRCAIVGGHVYSGTLHPNWVGKYFFGDFCTGEVMSLWPDANGSWQVEWLGQIPALFSTFGRDGDGEIYAAGFWPRVIYKLVPLSDESGG